MKNIFRKNQVIITALAIMIAVAGYLNFTQDNIDNKTGENYVQDSDDGTVATSGENLGVENGVESDGILSQLSEESTAEMTDIVEGTEVEDSETKPEEGANEAGLEDDMEDALTDLSEQDIVGEELAAVDVSDSGELLTEASNETEGTPGEAVLVNNTINGSFFSAAKISREQTRAKNKEMLMNLIENTNITESQKQEAIDSVINLTSIAEKENATEIMLEAKGFNGAVVSIVEDQVDVVVNVSNITKQQIAQIEDIVKRKTGVASEAIVISPVVAE